MNLYLTFDHYYSGIIQSQVVDVVEYLESQGNPKLKIIAFVNIRTFRSARKKFKTNCPRVIVLPNFGFSRWKLSLLFLIPLCMVYRPFKIVGRSMFATQLALRCRILGLTKRVAIDSRGAEYAEWKEYFFPNDEGPLTHQQIWNLERDAVASSDLQLAVSNALVDFWKSELKVDSAALNPMIVPSTLALSVPVQPAVKEGFIVKQREKFNIPTDALVFVFSGAASDWHGMSPLLNFCEALATKYTNAFFVFLSNHDFGLSTRSELNERSLQTWVKQHEVTDFLCMADYGLLLREPSFTNKVASPVKFAEYLACGLHVLISEEIGDLSVLVKQKQLGLVVEGYTIPNRLESLTKTQRQQALDAAASRFTKDAHQLNYQRLFY